MITLHLSPPARIFKASILDSHTLMPKLLPDAIKSIEFIKGDGGARSIKQINFSGGKFEGSPDGGSISKMTTTIYPHGEFEIKEEELKVGKEKVLGLYKVVEAYLLKNPNAYV
ncbi:putative START-like domain superfamily protein [Helianthus anomalus]